MANSQNSLSYVRVSYHPCSLLSLLCRRTLVLPTILANLGFYTNSTLILHYKPRLRSHTKHRLSRAHSLHLPLRSPCPPGQPKKFLIHSPSRHCPACLSCSHLPMLLRPSCGRDKGCTGLYKGCSLVVAVVSCRLFTAVGTAVTCMDVGTFTIFVTQPGC